MIYALYICRIYRREVHFRVSMHSPLPELGYITWQGDTPPRYATVHWIHWGLTEPQWLHRGMPQFIEYTEDLQSHSDSTVVCHSSLNTLRTYRATVTPPRYATVHWIHWGLTEPQWLHQGMPQFIEYTEDLQSHSDSTAVCHSSLNTLRTYRATVTPPRYATVHWIHWGLTEPQWLHQGMPQFIEFTELIGYLHCRTVRPMSWNHCFHD